MSIVAVVGSTFTYYLPGLEDQANPGLLKAAPTIAAGDFTISTNGGAFEAMDNTPTVKPTGSKQIEFILSAAETTAAGDGGTIVIECSDASGAEWFDVAINVPVRTADLSTGDTYSAVAALGSGTGAALNFAAGTDNTGGAIKSVTFVGTQANTYASTAAEDGTRHSITDSGGAPDIDIVYQFDIGAGRNAAKVIWKGYVTNADTVTVQAYNGSTWDTRATITGTNSTANVTRDISLLAVHTGTGADAGKVYIRFTSTGQSSIVVHTDEMLVAGVAVGMTSGYADGAVWVKATGTAGTTPYINGTADNPCPWANALTVAAAVGLTRFRIINGETVTLTAACDTKSLIGQNWYLALGGQSVSGSYFAGASLSGIATGASAPMFHECWVNGITTGPANFDRCGVNTTVGAPFTAGSAGQYNFIDCFSLVPGAGTPYFTFSGTGSTTGVNIRRWSGGSNITLDANCTMTMEVVTGGGQTVVTGGGNVEIRGICRSVTVTSSGSSVTQIDAIAGPITVAGTAGTVRIYGVCAGVTDNSSGLVTITNDAISQATVASGGTYSYTNTVDDGSGNLLDGVFVQCATDSSFVNVINTTHTNAAGSFTVYSDIAGTHYLRLQLAGYSFTDQTVTLA